MEDEPGSGPDANNAQQPLSTSVIPEGEAPARQTTGPESNPKADPAKDRLDRDLVRWTRMLACFTGGLVLAAGLRYWAMRGQLDEMTATRESSDKSMVDQLAVMRDQAKAMQGQLDQMDVAQRPWLKLASFRPVAVNVIEPFVVIVLDLHGANVGRQPAEGVAVNYHVFRTLGTTDERDSALKTCRDGIDRVRDDSDLVFPNEEWKANEYAFAMAISDIKADRDERLRERIRSDLELKSPLRSSFVVVGCITYKYRVVGPIGQTAFILDINLPCEESPVGKCSFDIVGPARYGAKDMLVTEERRGLFAR